MKGAGSQDSSRHGSGRIVHRSGVKTPPPVKTDRYHGEGTIHGILDKNCLDNY